MVFWRNLPLFIILSFIARITADSCSTPDGRYTYYCSGKSFWLAIENALEHLFLAGQSCGTSFGDCRGLPTYAVIGIVSVSIMFLSICIRCCIYANASNNPRPIQRRFIRPRTIRVRGDPNGNIYGTQPISTIVPVHNIVEDAPPSYEVATSIAPPKY